MNEKVIDFVIRALLIVAILMFVLVFSAFLLKFAQSYVSVDFSNIVNVIYTIIMVVQIVVVLGVFSFIIYSIKDIWRMTK